MQSFLWLVPGREREREKMTSTAAAAARSAAAQFRLGRRVVVVTASSQQGKRAHEDRTPRRIPTAPVLSPPLVHRRVPFPDRVARRPPRRPKRRRHPQRRHRAAACAP
jgi:hypothetical protein